MRSESKADLGRLEGAEKTLDRGSIRQGILGSAPATGESGRRTGEGNGLLEVAAGGQTQRQRSVEGVSRPRGVDNRYWEGGEMSGCGSGADHRTLLAKSDHHGPGAPVEKSKGGGAGRLRIAHVEPREGSRLVLVRSEAVNESKQVVRQRLGGGGVEDGSCISDS